MKDEKKTKRITVRLSENEKDIIFNKAKAFALSPSSYMRACALSLKPKSKADLVVADDVLHIAGDLGRLGGLFKMWLVANEDDKQRLCKKYSFQDVDSLVDEILKTQEFLKSKAGQLLGN